MKIANNKLGDIFTLPFVMKELEKEFEGVPATAYMLIEDGGKKSYNTAMLGYEPISAQWIVDALNAHDTHLADIDRLLGQLANMNKFAATFMNVSVDYMNSTKILDDERLKPFEGWGAKSVKLVTELREKYRTGDR